MDKNHFAKIHNSMKNVSHLPCFIANSDATTRVKGLWHCAYHAVT